MMFQLEIETKFISMVFVGCST